MDGTRLTARERRVLAEIERDLARDRPRRHGPRVSGRATALLAVAALGLFAAAVVTESPPLIWAFAALWAATLLCTLRLLLGWSHRHLTGDERPRPDEPDR
ncbi:hypothetical protein [Streptomyces sp. NPDC048659]|uniref:hypothetical protein n=1 Tax=Streptomyces sp. NPDC048659 TaxID=3155489 RepID=UPI0034351C7B